MTRGSVWVLALLPMLALACSSGGTGDDTGAAQGGDGTAVSTLEGVKLNQMQVIGSHNSYHVEPPADVLGPLIEGVPASLELAYTHEPLAEQFTAQGVRQIELDVFADPDGSLWSPIGTPGFKVMHIEQVDEGATCETFVGCLDEVDAWSAQHPDHMPIAILVEVKDTVDFPGGADPIPVDAAGLDALDDEIRSVFGEDEIITPADVQGDYPTLEEAVLDGNWPFIDDVRGQVMFLLDNKHDEYVADHPSLVGRVAFAPSEPGQPDAAFVKRNDPLPPNTAEIQDLVRAGYMVRTRADSPVTAAIEDDPTQTEAALASGAQWVSADYLLPGMSDRWGTTFVVVLPGGSPARCNPVNAPPGCEADLIEDLGLPLGPWQPAIPPPSFPVPSTLPPPQE